MRHVDRHGRLVALGSCLRRGLGVVGIDLIASGRDLQIVRPDARIDLHRAGNQVGVIGVAGIKAFALNSDRAAVHGVTGDGAIFQLRLAGAQGCAVGVDEAATVTGNAGRVGDHHLGALPRDFDIALKLAGIAGVDFVENDPRVAFGHRRVALDPATQLRLAVGAAVVEDHATLVDIELVVSVARNPGGARCLNIHLWRAVGAFDHRRTLTRRSRRIGHDARCPCWHDAQGHQPDRGHQRKAQRPQRRGATRCDGGATGAGARCLDLAGDVLRHHHQKTACLVENDSVQVLVHSNSICGVSPRNQRL
ncbi:Uncharacterized protein ABJ99_1000 [Pseudomonas syringae pv. cilantro]|uniref:Uncharacterized protein n=1 Tax=Pseudomonas syringae pv. cilantro TaxID=81035 RepID=A0A0N1JML2_PSESX|nr:Uncharacterized protein ABJ99_1000 [Pseudomonas syringae pv. cilantro]